MTLWNTLRDLERVMLGVVHDLVAITVRALFPDDRPPSTALIARHLRLRDHARHDLLTDNAHTLTVTRGTSVHIRRRRGASTAAVVAEDALLDHEVDARARVGVGKRDLELAHRRGPAPGLLLVPASTAEEALEHVERVRVVPVTALVCFETLFAMAVVYLPFGRVGEDFVRCEACEYTYGQINTP